MRAIVAILFLIFIFGCSMPATSVRTVDSRPSLSFTGAPPSAELFIDGIRVGLANTYNGKHNVLKLEPGTHQVLVIENGNKLYDQLIFINSEVKTIVIN